MDNSPNAESQKCSVVAICGAPNVGKSTLVNAIVGKKVSIISSRPQTTRTRLRGIVNKQQTQLIFVDTPGIFKPEGRLNNRLNRSIVETARNSFEGADFIIFTFDATKKVNLGAKKILESVSNYGSRLILVINKVDLLEDKSRLLALSEELNALANFDEVFMISAEFKKGVEDLENFLVVNSPQGFWLYPEDYITDQQSKFYAAEVTREKLFQQMRQEIPYGIMIQTEKFEETKKSTNIYQSIVCLSEDHKKIIIGKAGSMLKKIGSDSRKELTDFFGKKINLYLFVKVRKSWADDKESYLEQGIDYSKS